MSKKKIKTATVSHDSAPSPGGSRLLHPIHGREVLERSNIISNRRGDMRRMMTTGNKKGKLS
jgi:hypothetical protein